MSKYNSKGQLIEELDIHLDPLFTTQVPSEKVEENSNNLAPPLKNHFYTFSHLKLLFYKFG